MATYTAEVLWCRREQNFVSGIEVAGSASPHVVPLPYSATDVIDPEEAFVSSLSSCHMLWFLSIAARQDFVVDHCHDIAEGVMEKSADGKVMMTFVTLRPAVTFSGDKQPTSSELERLHHEAHDRCFIANSVKTEVRCEPR